MRRTDGSAGDVDYGLIGRGYAVYRQPDPRIGAYIDRALALARRVLNVGAGAGSHEPRDRDVVAVEPSAAMRAQRPPQLSVALDAVAEALPFADGEFDAAWPPSPFISGPIRDVGSRRCGARPGDPSSF